MNHIVKHILVAAFLLFWLACRPYGEQTTLTDDQIARIIADMNVAEAAANGLSGYSKDSLTHFYYDQVLKLHGTTKDEYEKNLHILANDLPRMHAILDQVDHILEPDKKETAPSNGKDN